MWCAIPNSCGIEVATRGLRTTVTSALWNLHKHVRFETRERTLTRGTRYTTRDGGMGLCGQLRGGGGAESGVDCVRGRGMETLSGNIGRGGTQAMYLLAVLVLAVWAVPNTPCSAEELPGWTEAIRQDHPRLFFNAQTWPAVQRAGAGSGTAMVPVYQGTRRRTGECGRRGGSA